MMDAVKAPDHVIAYRAEGTITGEEFDRFAEVVDERLARHERVHVYFDAVDWSDMTEEALIKRVQFGVGKLAEVNRFARMALVTDKQWLRALVRFSNTLFPMREIRLFEPGQQEEALAWVSEPPGH